MLVLVEGSFKINDNLVAGFHQSVETDLSLSTPITKEEKELLRQEVSEELGAEVIELTLIEKI